MNNFISFCVVEIRNLVLEENRKNFSIGFVPYDLKRNKSNKNYYHKSKYIAKTLKELAELENVSLILVQADIDKIRNNQ